ncbi:MAG: (Fe-S)-binding protein [Chloroflexi bacterium]|nr:MAG: (Fe-S)-binding protein [Chloroflexota bacterium]
MTSTPSEVTLFISCLTDTFFPGVGEDTVWLLEQCGLRVKFPVGQTCCGQPPFNAGYHTEACEIASHFLEVFANAEVIVTPSGSCATMLRVEYPHLFANDPHKQALAKTIASRTYELSEFLVHVMGKTDFGGRFPGRVTYHEACHLSRGLNIREEPRQLLAQVEGLELVEMDDPDWCCGFGGAFAVKQAAISGAMLAEKLRRIQAVAPDAVVTTDPGCIMHMAGGLQRLGQPIQVLHLAQVISGRAYA